MFFKAVISLFLLTGCSNHCQVLCENMAEFAQKECDIKVKQSQIDSCIDSFASSSDDEEQACETYAKVEDEEGWSCDIVSQYTD